MKTLNAPEDTGSLSIEGDEFPVVDGQVQVPNCHVQLAMQLGCTDPEADALIPPIMPTVDAEHVPAVNEALVQENEELRRENELATTEIDTLNTKLKEAGEGFNELSEEMREVENLNRLLVGSVEKLSVALTEAGGDPAAVLAGEAPPEATESAKEGQEGPAGGGDGGGTDEATDELPRLPDEMPDFSGFEYNALIGWVKGRKVALPAGINKKAAQKLCEDTYTEQKAAQDAADAKEA